MMKYLLVILLFTSCKVMKSFQSKSSDTASVAKKDSGQVRTNEGSNRNENAWYKETIVYPQARDCVINNHYPAIIYREGGRQASQNDYRNSDSSWRQALDSLGTKITSEISSKETKVLGFWDVVGIAAGIGLIFFILSKLKISFI